MASVMQHTQYVVQLAVNSTWSEIFTKLHTLTLTTSLLIMHMTRSPRPSISVWCSASHQKLDGGKVNAFASRLFSVPGLHGETLTTEAESAGPSTYKFKAYHLMFRTKNAGLR